MRFSGDWAVWGWTSYVDTVFNFYPVLWIEFAWSNFHPLYSSLDQGDMKITVIGITGLGRVTSDFGFYFFVLGKFIYTGQGSLISNAHILKKYISYYELL